MSKEDLDLFYRSLAENCDLILIVDESLERLSEFLDGVNIFGFLNGLLDPLKRDMRQSKAFVQSSATSARSQRDLSANFIEQGRTEDALAAINTGQTTIMDMARRLDEFHNHLYDVPAKSGMALENLRALNYEVALEAWRKSYEKWKDLTGESTWVKDKAKTS